MKKYIIASLIFILQGCSDDEKPAQLPPGTQLDAQGKPIAQRTFTQTKVISPEKIYIEKMKSAPDNWYLAELSSFAFIAKKQIDLIRLIQSEGSLSIPLYRNKFLTQLYGLNTILTYMRLPLLKINRGDTSNIRFTTLESVKMSYYAKKTQHAGEALLFYERAKDAYLKVSELSNRELLKPQTSAPYISADLKVNIYKSLEFVKQIFDDIETIENSDQGILTKNITEGINQAYASLDAVQAQTDGLGFRLDDIITPPLPKNGGINGTVGNAADLSLLTQSSGGGAPSYGLPSASALLQAGNTPQTGQQNQSMGVPLPITSAQNNSSLFARRPIQPVDRVNSVIGAEAAAGPYGAQPSTAGSSLFGGGAGTPAGVAPGTGGASFLPSLSSLTGGNYSGAPQAQPQMPTIPTAAPPPLPLPVPPTPTP